ncbi:mucin-4-like [Branchiostoma lanceolatum]|uniref:mucin-4-like n=1 Tax=Branchiostoma lanceolatum TaxID=7740 RepID=UPI00345648AC
MIILILVLSAVVDTSIYGQTIVRNGTTTPTPLWTSSQTQASVAGETTVPSSNRTTFARGVSIDRNADTTVSAKTRTTHFVNIVQSTRRSTSRLKSTDVTRTATKISTNRTMSMPFHDSMTKSSTPQPYTTSIRSIIRRQSTDTKSSATPIKSTRRRYTTDLSRRSTKIPTTNIVNPTASTTMSSALLGPASTSGLYSTNFSRMNTTEVLGMSSSALASTTPLDPTRMIPSKYVWNAINRHIYPNPRREPRRCRRPSPSWVCDPSGVFTTEQVDELDAILTSISLQSDCPCNEHCHHRTYGFVVTLVILYRYDPHPNQTLPITRHMRLSELSAGTCGEDTVVSYDFSRKMLNISTGVVAFQTLTDQLAEVIIAPYMDDITSQDTERNFIGLKGFLTVTKTVFVGTYNPPEMTDLERLFIAIGGSMGLLAFCSLFFCCIAGTRAFWGRKKKNPSSLDFDDEEDRYYDPKVEGTFIPFYHFIPEGTVGNKKRMGITEMKTKMETTKKNRSISTQEEDPDVFDDFDRFAKVGRAARLWKKRARRPPPQPPPPAVGNFRRSLTT